MNRTIEAESKLEKILRKTLAISALAIASIGHAYSADMAFDPSKQNKPQPIITQGAYGQKIEQGKSTSGFNVGGRMYYQDGTQSGQLIYNNDKRTSDDETYTTRLQELDRQIRINPNVAALYLQKEKEQRENKVSPQEMLNNLETALKQKGLIADDTEKAKIHHQIANNYELIAEDLRRAGNVVKAKEYLKKSLNHLVKEYEIGPIKNPNTKAMINYLTKIVN